MMKQLVVALLATCFLANFYSSLNGAVKHKLQANEKQSFAIEKLGWFTGRWEGPVKGGVLEESWLPPKGNTVTAVVRLTKKGDTEFVEMIMIQQQGASLELRLRLFDTELKPLVDPLVFRAVEQGRHSITFAGVSKEAHRTLSYERPSPNQFVIRWVTRDGEKTVINLSAAKP